MAVVYGFVANLFTGLSVVLPTAKNTHDSIHRCLHRCKSTEFNPNGQLFFNPLVQSMRMIVHFGETLPEKITPEHIIGSGLLFIWALCIFCGMLFCFGIGAATGQSKHCRHASMSVHGLPCSAVVYIKLKST